MKKYKFIFFLLILFILQSTLLSKSRLKEYFELGKESYLNGDFRSALQYFKEAVKITKKSPQIYNNIGLCYEKLKLYKKAKHAYEKALALDNNFIPTLNNLGILLIKIFNENNIGLSILYRANLLKKNDYYIISTIGEAYYYLKNYEEAIKWLTKAENFKLNTPKLHYLKAQCYLKLKKREKALNEFKKVLKLDGKFLRAYFGIIRLLEYGGEYKLAKKYLIELNKKALEGNPDVEESIEVKSFLNMYYKTAILNTAFFILREKVEFQYRIPDLKDVLNYAVSKFNIDFNIEKYIFKNGIICINSGEYEPSIYTYIEPIKRNFMAYNRKICHLNLEIAEFEELLKNIHKKSINIYSFKCPLDYKYTQKNGVWSCTRHGEAFFH